MDNFDIRHVVDWAAAGTAVATIAGYLPAIAALLSIIWFCIQIWDRFWRDSSAGQ